MKFAQHLLSFLEELLSAHNRVLSYLRNMTTYSQELVEMMINRVKLIRSKVIPASSFGQSMSEPNLGPFPQYNIIMEDEPIEEVIDSMERPARRHVKTGPIVEELKKILATSKDNLMRLQNALQGPLTVGAASLTSRLFGGSSFYQDHSQFVEDNVVPFQEVTIHPESAAPRGGDAPVVAFGRKIFQILDLNRTKDMMVSKGLLAEETRILQKLKQVDAIIRRNKLDL